MDSAQATFKAMMRDRIAPGIRELGFRGSGQHYSLPNATHWVLLGFQRSKWSTAEEVEFTVNITVVSKDEWSRLRVEHPFLPDEPAANTVYGPRVWRRRLGILLGIGDHWWTVVAGEPTAATAGDVLEAIKTTALPAMRAEIDRVGRHF
jgi:hypothetical protein